MTERTTDDYCLNQQVEWWKAVVSSIHDGVLVIDYKGIVRLVNPEYTRITGMTAEKIIGKPLRQFRPSAQLPDTLLDGKCRVGVYRKEENNEYVVDMAPIVFREEIIGAVSVCKSLTEVHKLTQKLQRQTERIKRLEKTMASLYQAKYTFGKIIGRDGGLKQIIHVAERAAETDLPVLIVGESGTGKELFAQSIHNASLRRDRPFIPVNCAAIPAELVESELFGYEDGSFTNAKQGGKIGLFELANQGTLFLDEIGDMSYDLQSKLLRVLQEGKIRRVGGAREKSIDVRVIAATNHDLVQAVVKKRFREDLFYRLNVIRIPIPPLRDRREDIPKLIDSFLQDSAVVHGIDSIDARTTRLLQSYDWPGNVRELKNAIDYAVCMAEGREIHLRHLPAVITKSDVQPKQEPQTLRQAIEETERRVIRETIYREGTRIEDKRRAAKLLGISLATLYNKINKYNIGEVEKVPDN